MNLDIKKILSLRATAFLRHSGSADWRIAGIQDDGNIYQRGFSGFLPAQE
ncbi:MAG: hypothetical protein HYV53_01245 [Parcubacteria group bacterium]|nr:hypothetical protein [Parcubacteria group bacterium]